MKRITRFNAQNWMVFAGMAFSLPAPAADAPESYTLDPRWEIQLQALPKDATENRHCAPRQADGTTRQVGGDRADLSASQRWCRDDGMVLFSPLSAPDGNLRAVRVEWLADSGAHVADTLVNLPPRARGSSWTFAHARLLDDCLGLSFRIQAGSGDAKARPRLVEYKVCPAGI